MIDFERAEYIQMFQIWLMTSMGPEETSRRNLALQPGEEWTFEILVNGEPIDFDDAAYYVMHHLDMLLEDSAKQYVEQNISKKVASVIHDIEHRLRELEYPLEALEKWVWETIKENTE